MATVKENLIAAKALIDTPAKWLKDDREYEDSCCAIVAVNRAFGTGGGWTDDPEAGAAHQALFDQMPKEWRPELHGNIAECVGDYNDAPETTHADIMALYDRAIAAQDEVA